MSGKGAMRPAAAGNPFEAFRELVYLHKVEKLAPLMGLSAGTLYNKADASEDTKAQPTVRDVISITSNTGDLRVLDALNEMFGRACYDCAQHQNASDESLLELLAHVGVQSGEFHGALALALKADSITHDSVRVIRGEVFDVVSALMTLVKRLEGYADGNPSA